MRENKKHYRKNIKSKEREKASRYIENKIFKCVSSMTYATNLQEECEGKYSENKSHTAEVGLKKQASSVFQRISDNVENMIRFSDKASPSNDKDIIKQTFSASITATAIDIAYDNNAFRKLKEELRSKQAITNYAVQQIIPKVLDSKCARTDLSLQVNLATEKKNRIFIKNSSLVLNKEKCGLRWNMEPSYQNKVLTYKREYCNSAA